MHRDFFPANLMRLADRTGPRRTGLLDFQDAAIGHPAYDLVSLVEDARRDVAPDVRAAAIARYLDARPDVDRDGFTAAMAACAAQRHLRVAALWVRLDRRDGKPHYLVHGPRCWRLLAQALAHPATRPLARLPRCARAAGIARQPHGRDGIRMIALTHAMVLAAGLGTRMRPLTDDRPKPLLELGGRSLLDHALDRLEAAGVAQAVVNAHWLRRPGRGRHGPPRRPAHHPAEGRRAAGDRRRRDRWRCRRSATVPSPW